MEKNFSEKLRVLLRTGFFHIFSASVLNKIIVFLSNIIVIRLISKVEFGAYTYALNGLSFALLISGCGLVTGTFQLCSEECDKDEKKQIYKYGCTWGIRINIVLSILILFFVLIFKLPIEGSNELLVLMSLNPIFLIVFDFQQIYLRSNFKNKEYSYGTTINTILLMILSILGSCLYAARGLIIGRYIAYILTALIMITIFKAPVCLNKASLDDMRKTALWKISIISMSNNGIAELLYLLDIFFLGLIITNEELVASYKVATVIPNACIFIPMAIVTYIYPYFAANRLDRDWCRSHYYQLLKSLIIINAIISLVLCVFSKQIIILVYGEKYLDCLTCFRILSIGYFFSGTFRVISGNLLVTQRKLKFNLFVNIICGIINIIGDLILIPKLYSIGAAITTFVVILISGLISTIYYLYLIRKE